MSGKLDQLRRRFIIHGSFDIRRSDIVVDRFSLFDFRILNPFSRYSPRKVSIARPRSRSRPMVDQLDKIRIKPDYVGKSLELYGDRMITSRVTNYLDASLRGRRVSYYLAQLTCKTRWIGN